MLRDVRLGGFLTDPDAPFTISAEMFQVHEHRKRALAESDGMVAGLKLLDKTERLGMVSAGAWTFDAEIAQGLRLLLSLSRAMQEEFQRFNDMASASASLMINHLAPSFPVPGR
jgi:hypothetical protein